MNQPIPYQLAHWRKTFDRLFSRWETVNVEDRADSVWLTIKTDFCFLTVGYNFLDGEDLRFRSLDEIHEGGMSGIGVRRMIGSEIRVVRLSGEQIWLEQHERLLRYWCSADLEKKMLRLREEDGALRTRLENALYFKMPERKRFLESSPHDFLAEKLSFASGPRSRSIVFRSSKLLSSIMRSDCHLDEFKEGHDGITLILSDANLCLRVDLQKERETVSVRSSNQDRDWLSIPLLIKNRLIYQQADTLEAQLFFINEHWYFFIEGLRDGRFPETIQLVEQMEKVRLKRRFILLNPDSLSE